MTAMMVEAALRGLALALIVGLGLSVLRVRNVPARKAAWTLVLAASLAMPALMRWPAFAQFPARFGWVLPVPQRQAAAVPPSPATEAASVPVTVEVHRQAAESSADLTIVPPPVLQPAPVVDGAADAAATKVAPRRAIHWPPVEQVVVWIYLAVAGALTMRLLIGLGAALRLWTTAAPVSPLVATEPHVRASERISSPVTIGSGIVLPAGYAGWSREKLRTVLAHEQSHVRQMDFYLQLLAGAYAAMFWFSPLGWWLRRRLASLGEEIGDRAGMGAAASRTNYAQIILEFAAMPRQSLPGVAMARPGNLSRRVESMLNDNHLRSAFAEGRRRALASLLLVPVALFAVTALVRVPGVAAQSASPAAQSVPQAMPPAVTDAPRTGVSTSPGSQATNTGQPRQGPASIAPAATPQSAPAPAAPASPPQVGPAIPPPPADAEPAVAPLPPEPPLPVLPPNLDGHATMAIIGNGNAVIVHGPHHFLINDGATVNGFGFHFAQSGDSYAVVQGPKNQFTFSGNWSGDFGAEIDKARKQTNGPFLWFHHDGKSYIVTDPATIAQIESLYAPMQELGTRQRLLGQTERNLGEEQKEMARAAQEARNLSSEDVAKMMAEIQAESKAAQTEWNARIKAEVDAEMKAAQAELSPQKMAELQAEMKTAENEVTPEKMAEVQARLQQAMKQMGSANMVALQARLKTEEDRWNAESTAQLQEEMARMQAELNAMRARLAARQGDFGVQMGKLGEEQGRLGEEQGRLGEQQGRLAADMDRQAQKIIQQTLQNGKAQPLH